MVVVDAAAAISAEAAMLIAGNEDDLGGSDPYANDEDLKDDAKIFLIIRARARHTAKIKHVNISCTKKSYV